MEIKISNFRVLVTSRENLKSLVCRHYQIKESDIEEFKMLRFSIDARKKNNVVYIYQFYLKLKGDHLRLLNNNDIVCYEWNEPLKIENWQNEMRPIIVGFGPAGMFAALYLARCGAKPIIIERGSPIEQRKIDVYNFLNNKVLDANSNVQFGEGGAGAFSDGKLTTSINHPLNNFILEEFYKHGAPEDILYSSMPHIGTDYLEIVVKNFRKEIESLGGEFYFNTLFTDFRSEGSKVTIYCDNGSSFTSQYVLMCIGHSARDTIEHLYHKGVVMESKSFSMGLRIEHLQSRINEMQYGRFAKFLPPASYKMAVHLKERSVYTFCMCPGGVIMASTNDEGTIVTNGMSEKSRSKQNANSALLVGIHPNDYYVNTPMDGLRYQEKYERLAFKIAGNYKAPCNLLGEFLQEKIAVSHRSVIPSYPHGVEYCDFKRCLPSFIVDSIRESIPLFDKKMVGFAHHDAVLTGIESRSSSPVRIVRDANYSSSISGIYPVGEGAGYAGGIVSAALDGLKAALAINKKEKENIISL